jgi:hypothetical protein
MCDMTSTNEYHGKSRRPGAEDQGWSSTCQVLGGRTVERSGDVMCGLHRAQGDEEHEFSWFGLKTKVYRLSLVWPQNYWVRFSGLGLKIGSYSLMI